MARFNDSAKVKAAFTPYLEPGEQIYGVAYGLKQPPIWAIILLFLLGILPGVIVTFAMTKEYVVAMTDRRFIALQFSGSSIKVKGVQAWNRNALPPVKTSTGALFTHIAIADPVKRFVAKFHRLGMPGQREEVMRIAATLDPAAAIAG